jgi:signal peptide peptidase SppA
MATLDANPSVSKILLNVTSPGGTVTGTPEASDAVRSVRDRGETQVVAIANGMMASAALWIGAAASELVVTPSGEIGSIGVISMYADESGLLEKMGVKVDIVRTPDKKARFSGLEPMTDEMRSFVESRIGASYEKFKRAMATNRGIRIDQVEAKFGGGEMMKSDEALEAGLVDRVATLDQTINRMMTRRAPAGARVALARAQVGN